MLVVTVDFFVRKYGSQDRDLAVQLDVFDEQRDTDEAQLTGPDGVDLTSHADVFYAILRQVRCVLRNPPTGETCSTPSSDR